MGQLEFLRENEPTEQRRGGPPNRMNDLSYTEWMKFQKSFFRWEGDQRLVSEFIAFFTKAVWPDGRPSDSLVLGFPDFDSSALPIQRTINHLPLSKPAEQIIAARQSAGEQFDFAMIDLRGRFKDRASVDRFVDETAASFAQFLRSVLRENRYCGLLVEDTLSDGFPVAWAVAQAMRGVLRLRDEKIGLTSEFGRSIYCLMFQAQRDDRPSVAMTSATLSVGKWPKPVPAWTIPKPPPRKKNEILHPAKYPETLVEEFIELFSEPGDWVLDPMVGTGSTVVAAIRCRRNGVGTDLSPRFASIAADRVSAEVAESGTLFGGARLHGEVYQFDATKLSELERIRGRPFKCAITSPPYWSMLNNPGSENQALRRERELPLVYSEESADLGNVEDYDRFLDLLDSVYGQVAQVLDKDGVLTVVVKNVKRNHVLHALAWDLTLRLAGPKGPYSFIGNTLWCQDDVGMKPFAVGIHWVSNIVHTYCLHFVRR
jgi:DNA modification methylase